MSEATIDVAEPVLPDYGGACVSNIVPALLQHREIGTGWLPEDVLGAKQSVLLVIDGLGYDQLLARAALAPTLMSMLATRITTVAPTTTATALTSIATGASPGEHGVVGYKIWTAGELLNVLRWSSPQGEASARIDPVDFQPISPFVGSNPPVVSQAQFSESGFTRAHLRDSHYRPYWMPSSIPVEIAKALDEGNRFVYAYYDGIDKIAHITGLGAHYDAELAFVDRLVADIAATLPTGTALVVTADHGQVQVGDAIQSIDPAVLDLTSQVSGEARFAWLHATGGRNEALYEAAIQAHSHHAWVVTKEQVLDEAWFGSVVSSTAQTRLGDVALVARESIALIDPSLPGPLLQSRHGSMTPAETYVPLLGTVA